MPSPVSHLNRWRDAALALDESRVRAPTLPLHVLLGEAVDVARFHQKYWEPDPGGQGKVARLGLSSAATRKTVVEIGPQTGAEILSLQVAAQEAHTAYLLSVDAKNDSAALPRARFLVNEIAATLEWLFDDGVEDQKDAQLASVVAAHADDPETTDALAGELNDYAGLAEPHREAMDGLGGFSAALIDEAHALAVELRERPTRAAPLTAASRAALALRNRVITLLAERVAMVRAAARFVFRDRPPIVREVTSAYERRRRVAAKRAAGNKPPLPLTPV